MRLSCPDSSKSLRLKTVRTNKKVQLSFLKSLQIKTAIKDIRKNIDVLESVYFKSI